jgi:hypothetical protein
MTMMTAPPGWKKRSTRFEEEFFTFPDIPGVWIRGTLLGTRPIGGVERFRFEIGDHDPRVTLPNDNPRIILPNHAQLTSVLEDIVDHAPLHIEYSGTRSTKNGRTVKTYNIYEAPDAIADAASTTPTAQEALFEDPSSTEPPATPDDVSAESDEDVPF